MHAGIFWGFVLLTIGTANIVTGGIIQPVLSIPFDGLLWALISAMQNVVAVIVLVSIGWAYYRRLVSKPRAADVQPGRAAHPRDDRRRRRDRAVRPGLRGRGARRDPRRVRLERPGRPAAEPSRQATLEAGFAVLWWAHIALVAAFLCYLPFSKHLHIATSLPEHLLPQARAARRAAEARPRGRERDVRAQDAPGPRLEGPARRLHLHRMRPLPAGLPGLEHRQAAQPQGHSSWASATCRWRPSTGSTSSRTRRSCARPTGSTTRRSRRRRWPSRSSTTRSRTTRSGTA